MKAEEVFEILNDKLDHFISNDFAHVRRKVDWIFYTLITLLLGIISGLVLLVLRIKAMMPLI